MPHYYVNFTKPPPFAAILPGAIGYLSLGGLKILYGKKQAIPFVAKPKDSLLMRIQASEPPRLKQPDGPHSYHPHPSVTAPKVLAKMRNEYLKPKDFAIPKGALKICEICDAPETKKQMTRHHVTPKHIRKMKSVPSRGVRYVCRPCHTEIHKLFSHEELVALDWDQVVLFMRNVA